MFSFFKKKVVEARPLVWTTKGNLPVDTLEYKYGWEEDTEKTVFFEEYHLKGELVKRTVHIRAKQSLAEMAANQGAI